MFKNRFLISVLFIILNNSYPQNSLNLKNDNVQLKEDESITISVLKNDNIKDKSNLIIELSEKPQNGDVEIQGEQIIYTPSENFNGLDKFSYKVDTGMDSGTAQVKVNVNPVNDAPNGLSLNQYKIKENLLPGTIIGELLVKDPDSKEKFKFGLAKENRDDFKIENGKLLSKRKFDFEKEKSYEIMIQITDSGNEKFIGSVTVIIENQNEVPILSKSNESIISHPENGGKIVANLNVTDPDENQPSVKYKINKGDDGNHFKITRSGDLAFLRLPDYENPIDENKDNLYKVSFTAFDSKNDNLKVNGSVKIKVKDSKETEVLALDKRKFIAWTVDHQPYHIILEDAIKNYMSLKYLGANKQDKIEYGQDSHIKEMIATDQIIIVQKKDDNSQIHELWYGNGLDFTIIDREKIDWVLSQDIQKVLIEKDGYLTSDSETVFHKNEKDRLMAGYGSAFSVRHVNNFRMSLNSFSIRSNLMQYSSNMRVGNDLIGLPGKLAGASEIGVATQRSEFGLRVPVSFDFGSMNDYKNIDIISDEYIGLYARGNIDNIFETKTSLYSLIGFSFYPSSSKKLVTPQDISETSLSDISYWTNKEEKIESINILDSYALLATSVEVPVKLPSIGRLTASPGYHYLKVAHRLKDSSDEAEEDGIEMYERAFFNYTLSSDDSLVTWSSEPLTDQDTFTRLNSFFIRFDLTGQIGQKPKFVEKISYLDFINISKVPFYELSFQYISSLNSILKVNVNISDQVGLSVTKLDRNSDLKGNWMPPNNLWWSLNYRANF